jgi:hypothetical protein
MAMSKVNRKMGMKKWISTMKAAKKSVLLAQKYTLLRFSPAIAFISLTFIYETATSVKARYGGC